MTSRVGSGHTRRRFLARSGAALAALTLPTPLWGSEGSGPRPIPEYDGTLDDVLFVYDLCAAPHLLRQVVEILRLAPVDARVHALVSRGRSDEARAALATHGFDAIRWIVTDEDDVSGFWGRDILQVGRARDGKRIAHVPWFKSATQREDLERTVRALAGLEDHGIGVQLLPVAAEGGNMIAGDDVLFAGSTIAFETRAITQHFWGFDPGDDGVARILQEAFGVDSVQWIGPRPRGTCRPQSRYVFHVDMLMTLLGPHEAIVARCDPARLDTVEHRAILDEEAARTLESLERREAMGIAWPDGLELPRDASARGAFLDERLRIERELLASAASEMDAAARQLESTSWRVDRIDADPRRVRRFQSATNVVCARDRLLVPLYPHRELVHGWVVRRDGGRDAVGVDLGLRDSDFSLTGDNLDRVEFFRTRHAHVRAVRDYFYLASGNVHCVVGRLS